MIDMNYDAQTVCLAQVVHGEAQGESVAGKEAVAQVVLNRVKSGKYPKSICGVVKQRGQFYGWKHWVRPSAASYRVAVRVMIGDFVDRVGSRLYFNTIGPKRAIRIGNHKFW